MGKNAVAAAQNNANVEQCGDHALASAIVGAMFCASARPLPRVSYRS
jgi:hypothetical protein